MTTDSEMRAEPVDLVLQVSTRWEGGDRVFEFELRSPSGAVGRLSGTTHRSRPLGEPGAFQQDLLHELGRLRGKHDVHGTPISPNEVLDTLAEIGRWLYGRLFPRSLRKAYLEFRDKVSTLLVISDEAWIPWELLRPYEDGDDDFFCMRFEMGRWLAEADEPVATKGVRRLLCVTVGAPEGQIALSEVDAECRILKNLAADIPEMSCLVLEDVTSGELKDHLSNGVDLFHYAGYGEHQRDDDKTGKTEQRSEWASIDLADRPFRNRELGGDLAARLRQDRPVVFFSSCEGGRLGRTLTGLAGWADSWIRNCSASAFLAPFLPIEDTTAREIAAIFYRELREGRTVGDALLTARREIRRTKTKDNLAWLAYSLHGHPNLRVVLGKDVIQTVKVVERESPLRLPEHRWSPDLSPPGALLRAEYRVVPFHFRVDEIDNLEEWCRDGKSLGIRLYTGAGGWGKTRLALEICRRLRSEGWQAGLVDHERPAEETWSDLVEIGGPRLLIVDYAETRRPLLVPLLRQIYEREDNAPVRVLLLARAALDWWDHLKAEGAGVGDLLIGPATRWHTLQPLALSTEDRAESYQIAAQAFSDELNKDLPEEIPGDLDAEHYKRALLLHMTALAAIDGVEVKGEDGILDYVLDRERRFWKKHAVDRKLAPEMSTGIGRAMAAITLGGGVDDEEKAVLAIRGLKFFHDEKESVLTSVARLLRETYPGENRWIDPVMPDLLGEHLVMREMELDSDELLDLVLGPRATGGEELPSLTSR